MAKKKVTKQKKRQAKKPVARTPVNPFLLDNDHMGEMTVRQLVDLVSTDEFPKGLDTRICISDVDASTGVHGELQVTSHKTGDIVLSIDKHRGDRGYLDELLSEDDMLGADDGRG